MNDARTFDYVIVGAGSAGCTLAYRLSEDPEIRVLVLEAGGWDRDPLISVPWGWGKILFERLHDWGYFTEPEPHMNGREIECARGKVSAAHRRSTRWPMCGVTRAIMTAGARPD